MPCTIHQQPVKLFQKCLLRPKDNKDTYAKDWEAYKKLRASAIVTQEEDAGKVLKGGNVGSLMVTITDAEIERIV